MDEEMDGEVDEDENWETDGMDSEWEMNVVGDEDWKML